MGNFRAMCGGIKVCACAAVSFVKRAMTDNGEPSSSRLLSAVVVMTWVYIALRSKSIPERTPEVAVIVGALYGVNSLGGHIRDALSILKGGPPDPEQS